MYRNATVGAVIPAYNEEAFIGEVIETLPSFVDRAYVIDDASTDDTWEMIRRHAAAVNDPAHGDVARTRSDANGRASETSRAVGGSAVGGSTVFDESSQPFVVPIQHERNRGVGGAIKTGYKHALSDGIDVTVVVCGDGQTDPRLIERVIEPVVEGRADYAKGTRLHGRHREGMPAFRQVGNFMLSLLTKIASGYWKVTDPQNGSTAISLAALEEVDLDSLYEDYGFANDLLVRLNVHEMRVADVPWRAVYGDETSSIRYQTFIPKLSYLLLRDFLWRINRKYVADDFHLLAGFYYLGAAVSSVGFASLCKRALRREDDPLASLLLFAFGWLFLLSAMAMDREENDHLQPFDAD
jgi:glycosyltransferase involved in cell wall biosynthesis